jgi:hypothetical protein
MFPSPALSAMQSAPALQTGYAVGHAHRLRIDHPRGIDASTRHDLDSSATRIRHPTALIVSPESVSEIAFAVRGVLLLTTTILAIVAVSDRTKLGANLVSSH